MAAVPSVLALDLLRQLDEDLAVVLLHVDVLADVPDRSALTAAVGKLEATRTALRDRIVGCMSTHTAEWSGALVSARVLAILGELAMLRDAAASLPEEARPFGDAFASVAALAAHVIRGIERIVTVLDYERQIARAALTAAERGAWDNLALAKADIALAEIGRDDRLVRALRHGARMPSLVFALACRALLLSLDARIAPCEGVPELPPLPRRTTEGLS